MRFPFSALAAFFLAAPVVAGPKVAVVVGPAAPKLERLAADEAAALLKQLFDADAAVAEKVPDGDAPLILVGSPATNPAVAAAVGDKWPKLTEQGHVLRSVTVAGRPTLVAGGGSPVATLWAVYEVGHHFGVRPFLHGDVLPEKTSALKLDGIDQVFEPAARMRVWRVDDDDPIGFAGWGLDPEKSLFRQLAKLKFNRVVLGTRPAVPFGGRRFLVAGDTPGRKAFKGAKVFANPDQSGPATEAARRAAAAEFGLEVGGPVGPVEFRGFLPRVPTDFPATADGFTVAAEIPGDLGPTAYFLARRAFDPKLTPKASHTDYLTPIIGAGATERVMLGFDKLGQAERLIAKNDKSFATPSPEMLTKLLASADPPPEWWAQAGKLYAGATDEMYRGIRATFNDPARPVLLYYAKRCEFANHYFAAIGAARLAGQAKAKGDKEAAAGHLEKATESMYNALNALGDVARDPSDRGAIAVLAEYAYRPLTAALKAADKEKE